jgi:hypothetical protein
VHAFAGEFRVDVGDAAATFTLPTGIADIEVTLGP